MLTKKACSIVTIRGFTLVEVVIIILVIGIISVTVLPQWTATTLNLEFEARRVLNDIRYAQALSMSSGLRYRWVKASSTAYQLVNSSGSALVLPSGGTQLTLTSGISFGSFTNLPNNLIVFDSVGVPYTDTSTPGTALAAAAIIPITANGSTRTIQITPQTGYGMLQ